MLTGLLMWVGGDARAQRRRVPALLGAADGPVRPGHRVDAGPGSPAGARCCGRSGHRCSSTPSTTGTCPSCACAVGRGLRGARLAHHPAAAPTRHGRRRAARPRLRVQALPRRVRRPADALRAHRARSRRGRRTGGAPLRVGARRHRHGGAGQPAVRARGLRGLARVVHVPGAAQGRHHHQLDLVLGLPARFRADERGVPGAGWTGCRPRS